MKITRLYMSLFMLLGVFVMPSHLLHAAEEGGESKAPKKEAPKEGEGGEGSADKNKKASTDISGGRFAGDPVYVHLAPMTVPVISPSGVEQLVTIQIDVEVKDFDVADHMETIMPRITDSLMRALYGGLGQGTLRNGKQVDILKLKSRATAAIKEVVGSEGITNVLIQGIAQRML